MGFWSRRKSGRSSGKGAPPGDGPGERKVGAAPAPPAAEDTEGRAGIEAPPSLARDGPASPAGSPTDDAIFRDRIVHACRMLSQQHAHDLRGSDGALVLEALTKDGALTIRQPPAAVLEAMRIVQDPEVSISQVQPIFERDPKLAQSLLQTANSAFYRRGAGTRVSLRDAVILLGTGGTYNVLLESALRGTLQVPGGSLNATAGQVWSHLARTARLGRFMGPAFGVPPDDAVTLGLLHDVGKLVVFDRLAELRRRLRRDLRLPERFVLDALMRLHEPLGARAVLDWRLGQPAAHSVSIHHRRTVPDAHDAGSELIYVVERLDLARLRGQEIDWDALWADGRLAAERGDVETTFEVSESFLADEPGDAAAA
jgi:HD-like signal output (HDOD) protein